MKKFIYRLLIFLFPVVLILLGVEFYLRNISYSVTKKRDYLAHHSQTIQVMALGSSHYERGINPEYLDFETINFGNSGQRIFENYRLFKNFEPKLPELNLVIVEMSFDWLERDKSITPEIIDHENLVFFNTNTFNRPVQLWDYSLYISNSDYYTNLILDSFQKTSDFGYNKYGFDTLKFYGSYEAAKFNEHLIKDEDIYVENADSLKEFKKNTRIFKSLIEECQEKNIDVLIYNTPSHFRYNNQIKKSVIKRRDSLLEIILKDFPKVKVLDLESARSFEYQDFYNADHLNPVGAKKATIRLNQFIKNNYSFN